MATIRYPHPAPTLYTSAVARLAIATHACPSNCFDGVGRPLPPTTCFAHAMRRLRFDVHVCTIGWLQICIATERSLAPEPSNTVPGKPSSECFASSLSNESSYNSKLARVTCIFASSSSECEDERIALSQVNIREPTKNCQHK